MNSAPKPAIIDVRGRIHTLPVLTCDCGGDVWYVLAPSVTDTTVAHFACFNCEAVVCGTFNGLTCTHVIAAPTMRPENEDYE